MPSKGKGYLADHRTLRPALLRAGMWQAPRGVATLPQPARSDVHCASQSPVCLSHLHPAGMQQALRLTRYAVDPICLTCRELACDRLPAWGRSPPQDCIF